MEQITPAGIQIDIEAATQVVTPQPVAQVVTPQPVAQVVTPQPVAP